MKTPRPPLHLDKTGREEYRKLVELLKARGLYDEGRLFACEGYAAARSRWIAASKVLASGETDGGALARAREDLNTAHRHVRDFSRDLGLPAQTQVRNRPGTLDPATTAKVDDEARLHAELNEALAGITH